MCPPFFSDYLLCYSRIHKACAGGPAGPGFDDTCFRMPAHTPRDDAITLNLELPATSATLQAQPGCIPTPIPYHLCHALCAGIDIDSQFVRYLITDERTLWTEWENRSGAHVERYRIKLAYPRDVSSSRNTLPCPEIEPLACGQIEVPGNRCAGFAKDRRHHQASAEQVDIIDLGRDAITAEFEHQGAQHRPAMCMRFPRGRIQVQVQARAQFGVAAENGGRFVTELAWLARPRTLRTSKRREQAEFCPAHIQFL